MKRSLRSWLWRVDVTQEVDDEIAFHIEMRARELVERGVDVRIAREMVLARLGDVRRLKRTCVDLGRKREREMRLTQWVGEFRDDVTFAIRQLKSTPGFTAVAVITLALGIGANSAMFAVADATLLRPLPFPDADRLMMLSEIGPAGNRSGVNPLDFVDWTERNRTFDAIAAVLGSAATVTAPDGTTERVPAKAVTARFFDVLGVRPIAGRTFQPADEVPMPDVVVLSEPFWRSHFGGNVALVGHTIRLNGRIYTVIGIVPASFQFDLPGGQSTGPSTLWTVLNPPPDRSPAQRYPHYLQVIGRLKPGVTLEAARADLAAVADGIARESPATNKGHSATVDKLRDRLTGAELRLTSLLLVGVVGFVLLMCCANVANLLLARTTVRARELAVRSALGAGRRRIVRQMLTESLVLATLGGLFGAGIGVLILRVTPALIPPGLVPLALTIGFDYRVLMFCAATALVVAIACGLAPAWQATGMSLVQSMTLGSRTATGSLSALRRAFAIAQVAVAVLLLCGAGLLLRTLLTLQSVDPGHRASELLTMMIGTGISNDPEFMRRYYEAVTQEVERVPGVRDVALGSALPLRGLWYGQTFEIDGDPPRPQANRDGSGYQIVSPSYFRVLDIPILAGRVFTDDDRSGRPEVCVVDEGFVRRYLNGREPIGTRLLVNGVVQPPRAVLREIVGVVGHVKERPDEVELTPHIYVPIAQNPWWQASLLVQPSSGEAVALASPVRAAVTRVDRDRPATVVRTLADVSVEATARPRFRAVFVGAFSLLALVLAMVGVFGVLAYLVQLRSREFGVRMALGASASAVLRLVVSSAVAVIGIGLAIGIGVAAALSRSMATFLFGVRPLDAVTFSLVPLMLLITAAIAVAVPAWRATRVDPVEAFRAE